MNDTLWPGSDDILIWGRATGQEEKEGTDTAMRIGYRSSDWKRGVTKKSYIMCECIKRNLSHGLDYIDRIAYGL